MAHYTKQELADLRARAKGMNASYGLVGKKKEIADMLRALPLPHIAAMAEEAFAGCLGELYAYLRLCRVLQAIEELTCPEDWLFLCLNGEYEPLID